MNLLENSNILNMVNRNSVSKGRGRGRGRGRAKIKKNLQGLNL